MGSFDSSSASCYIIMLSYFSLSIVRSSVTHVTRPVRFSLAVGLVAHTSVDAGESGFILIFTTMGL